jgi:hypothetical protein
MGHILEDRKLSQEVDVQVVFIASLLLHCHNVAKIFANENGGKLAFSNLFPSVIKTEIHTYHTYTSAG